MKASFYKDIHVSSYNGFGRILFKCWVHMAMLFWYFRDFLLVSTGTYFLFLPTGQSTPVTLISLSSRLRIPTLPGIVSVQETSLQLFQSVTSQRSYEPLGTLPGKYLTFRIRRYYLLNAMTFM